MFGVAFRSRLWTRLPARRESDVSRWPVSSVCPPPRWPADGRPARCRRRSPIGWCAWRAWSRWSTKCWGATKSLPAGSSEIPTNSWRGSRLSNGSRPRWAAGKLSRSSDGWPTGYSVSVLSRKALGYSSTDASVLDRSAQAAALSRRHYNLSCYVDIQACGTPLRVAPHANSGAVRASSRLASPLPGHSR